MNLCWYFQFRCKIIETFLEFLCLYFLKNLTLEVGSRWQCGKMLSEHLPTIRVSASGWWKTLMPMRWEEPPSEPPPHAACRTLVHKLGIRPKLLSWELQVQTTVVTENLRPQGVFIGGRSQRSSSQHQDPVLPNSLQTPVLEASGQTTSKTGTQSHS